jgi:tetratricopeptide (TPR) repeat protein
MRQILFGTLAIGLFLALPGCSIKKMAINGVAGTLGKSAEVFGSDDDPELVRDAMPFGLKTMETLLAEAPENDLLLLSASSGFTQYAYGFIQLDADLIEFEDYEEAKRLRERALKMYLRALEYGLRGLEVRYEGVREGLRADPDSTVGEMELEDIDFLYWTAAAWGSAIALGQERPELVADLSTVFSLAKRCLALDESYGQGAIHEMMMSFVSLPINNGGDLDQTRVHYDRAIELSEGSRAGTYVTLATTVSVPTQNREEFTGLLEQALAIDPDEVPRERLANLLAQIKARYLLENVDEYFF